MRKKRKSPGCALASTAISAGTATAAPTAWSGSGTAAGIPASMIHPAAAWRTGRGRGLSNSSVSF